MTPFLSVIIPVLDDPEIGNTVRSIRETAPDVEIVVVNDASTNGCWQNLKGCVVVHNRQRCGSGPSRHIGSIYASGEWLLHTDSHMRFEKGWYEKWLEVYRQRSTPDSMKDDGEITEFERTVFCGTMIALDQGLAHRGEYSGATLNLIGPDPGDGNKTQVFEENWMRGPTTELQSIACVMGACYFVNREWYLRLAPHRNLRSWGKEEAMLSVKTWLSGGSVYLLKSVRVGHIFRGPKESPPYEIPHQHLLYNKLFCLWTLLPLDLVHKLLPKLEKTVPRNTWLQATELISQDTHLIAAERAESNFTMTFADYCERFKIAMP